MNALAGCRAMAAVALLWLGLLEAAGQVRTAAADYPAISGPCDLVFPQDHGPHPAYRTEWWYYTGNLESKAGRRFGYQLTFFRSRLRPDTGESTQTASAWRTPHLFLAHAAVSDPATGRFWFADRLSRAALGMAGASREGDGVRVVLRNWSAHLQPRVHRLEAAADDFRLDLTLVPLKAPVAHGDRGYSRKGPAPEQASCYYSFTRLKTSGRLAAGGEEWPVSGLSWMDHEFSSAPLASGLVGWDWFSLQLSDGSDLMLYLLRQADGSFSPSSGGTFVAPDGSPRPLFAADVVVTPLATWKSPASGAIYPARWRVQVHSLDLDLTVAPSMPAQELQTPETTGVTYWEGSVDATGRVGRKPLSGRGFVELTGYAKPFDAPL
ncbi:MAG: lipocalin-like domain-containing protein [Desulfobacterales bacterium]